MLRKEQQLNGERECKRKKVEEPNSLHAMLPLPTNDIPNLWSDEKLQCYDLPSNDISNPLS